MFSVLCHYGIPQPMVSAIGVLYKNPKSAVMVDGHISETLNRKWMFWHHSFLFTVLIDYLMKKAKESINSGVVTQPRSVE